MFAQEPKRQPFETNGAELYDDERSERAALFPFTSFFVWVLMRRITFRPPLGMGSHLKS